MSARADFHRFRRQRRGLMSAMTKIVLGTGNLRKNYLDNVIHILDNVLPNSDKVLPTSDNVLHYSKNVLLDPMNSIQHIEKIIPGIGW